MSMGTTIFEDLAPFASMIIDQGRGVTVSDLAFASAQDYWSTGVVAIDSSTAGQVNANSEAQLFSAQIGEQGQGFTANLTRSQTNNVAGSRMASNQVYIGLKTGFHCYHLDAVNDLDAVKLVTRPQDLYAIMSNFVWSLNVGDGIKRDIGALVDFPAGAGVYASNIGASVTAATAAAGVPTSQGVQNGGPNVEMRKLPLPVIFPPNIKVDIRVQCGNEFTLIDTGFWATSDGIAIKQTFRGYMMTLPA